MKEHQSIFTKIVNRLGSLKLAVIVLIIFGIASIGAVMLGTFFPAYFHDWEAHYIEKYGESTFSLMKTLGVFDPYHSFWYTLILAFLTLILVVCSLKRLRGNLRMAFGVSFKESIADMRGTTDACTVEVTGPADRIIDRLGGILRKKWYRVRVREKGGGLSLFADRWGISRLGSFCMHAGFVVTVLGGLIASLLGDSSFYWGNTGDYISVPEADFDVRIDGFEIQENELGQIKDYLSTVTVMENGDSLFSKVIEVNHPLRYGGLNFFQSSYRPDDRRFEEAVVAVRDTSGEIVSMVKLRGGERSPVANTSYSLQPIDFAGNFMMRGKEVFSDQRFSEFRNPAVKVNLFSDGELIREGWVFSPQLAGFHVMLEELRFELLDVTKMYQTGLRVNWNPGFTFIWMGMILMTVGVCLTFFLSHRQIWAVVETRDSGKSLLALSGRTNRDKESFARHLRHIETIISQGKPS